MYTERRSDYYRNPPTVSGLLQSSRMGRGLNVNRFTETVILGQIVRTTTTRRVKWGRRGKEVFGVITKREYVYCLVTEVKNCKVSLSTLQTTSFLFVEKIYRHRKYPISSCIYVYICMHVHICVHIYVSSDSS